MYACVNVCVCPLSIRIPGVFVFCPYSIFTAAFEHGVPVQPVVFQYLDSQVRGYSGAR